MKADEPGNRVRPVKYGLVASEVPAFEAHYSILIEERQAVGAAVAHQNLQRAAKLLASLQGEGVVGPTETATKVVAPEPIASPVIGRAILRKSGL